MDDKKFCEDFLSFKSVSALGYHTYGGYWMFFRPDIIEVIDLMMRMEEFYDDNLSTVKRVYVTTKCYPSSLESECYNNQLDRHLGQTFFFIVYK